jgi:acetyl-CoA carboxylase carboxyl transferase subunit beta
LIIENLIDLLGLDLWVLMIYVPYDYYNPNHGSFYSSEGDVLNPPGLTVLEYLKEQRRIRDLMNPLSMGERGDPTIGLWARCENCGAVLYIKHLRQNDDLCMNCGFHLKMSSISRINLLVDPGSWRPLFADISSCDPLEFEDYEVYTERVIRAQKSTDLLDAIQTGTGIVNNIPIAVAVMDFGFMGGSMGSVVGEKLTRLIEYATIRGLPVFVICASGGARMQEGSLSLMQMAKISSALHKHQKMARLPYAALLTSPTTGGVTASFGMLGDFILTEPRSLIGFAGRRVIEATIGEILPTNFQTSEYMLERGHVDAIVDRFELREILSILFSSIGSAKFKKPGSMKVGELNGLGQSKEESSRRLWRREYSNYSNSFYPKKSEEKIFENLEDWVSSLNLKEKKAVSKTPFWKNNLPSFADCQERLRGCDPEKLKKLEKRKRKIFYAAEGFSYNDHFLRETVDPRDMFTNRVVLKNPNEFPLGVLKQLGAINNYIDIQTKKSFHTKAFLFSTDLSKPINFKTQENIINPNSHYQSPQMHSIVPFSKRNTFLGNPKSRYIYLLQKWFLNFYPAKGYLNLLLTFEGVFDLFACEIALKEKTKSERVPFFFNYDRDSKSKIFNVLDESIAFAKAQSIQWRTRYEDPSIAWKLKLFERYTFIFPVDSKLKSEFQKQNKFYYSVQKRKLDLFERREAARLADPERVKNERRARNIAQANSKIQNHVLGTQIGSNFKYILEQKRKKPANKKKD